MAELLLNLVIYEGIRLHCFHKVVNKMAEKYII